MSPRSHTISQTHNSTFSRRSERECLRGEQVSHLPKRVPRAEATLVCDRGGHVTGEEQRLLSREPVSGFTEAGRSAETSLCARLLSTESSVQDPGNPRPGETLVRMGKAAKVRGGRNTEVLRNETAAD